MKFGTTIFLFAVILIAFGFVISEDLRVREQNVELLGKLQEQIQLIEQLQEKLATCEGRVVENQEFIEELEYEIVMLDAELREAEKTIAALQAMNGQMQVRIDGLDARNRDLETQILKAEKLADTPDDKKRIVDIQNTTSIFLVIILIALITLNLALNSRSRSHMKNKQGNNEYIRLTPQERSLIARHRRSQSK